MGRLVHASIGVPDRVRLDQGRCGGVLERVLDELGTHVIGDGPTDDFLRKAVNDGGEVDEPLPSVDVGTVPDELLAGAVGGGVTLDEVGHVRSRFCVSFGGDAEGPWLAGHEGLMARRGGRLRTHPRPVLETRG